MDIPIAIAIVHASVYFRVVSQLYIGVKLLPPKFADSPRHVAIAIYS